MSNEFVRQVYEQVARLAKSMGSPKRLELIELLCQAPKSVETLATETKIGVTLASAHLKELRLVRLVETEKQGRQVVYRLASPEVASLLVMLRTLAADRLLEMQDVLQRLNHSSEPWVQTDGPTLLKKARRGEVTVLDVRPSEEYETRHLPHARNIPIGELSKRIRELPKGKPVIAYCRGPYCIWSIEAVELLRKAGHEAYHWSEGPADWMSNDVKATEA